MSMEAISYTFFRSNLAKKMKEICANHLGIIVTRKNNESVVILSLEDYRALEETAYLLRSPKNAKRLLDSMEDIEKGNFVEKELIEE
jgi:antitoxin YefM